MKANELNYKNKEVESYVTIIGFNVRTRRYIVCLVILLNKFIVMNERTLRKLFAIFLLVKKRQGLKK